MKSFITSGPGHKQQRHIMFSCNDIQRLVWDINEIIYYKIPEEINFKMQS